VKIFHTHRSAGRNCVKIDIQISCQQQSQNSSSVKTCAFSHDHLPHCGREARSAVGEISREKEQYLCFVDISALPYFLLVPTLQKISMTAITACNMTVFHFKMCRHKNRCGPWTLSPKPCGSQDPVPKNRPAISNSV
jgi:hypothetical protein